MVGESLTGRSWYYLRSKCMAFSPKTLRITAASVLSVFLVAGAYAVSGPVPFLTGKTVDAQSTDELLKAYASKDTDSDGLPDWEESLYGTDPSNPHSVNEALTDREAVNKGMVTPKISEPVATDTSLGPVTTNDIPGVDPAPGSITEQFGQEFFQAYMTASRGGQLSDEQKNKLIGELLASFSTKAGKVLMSPYTSVSVRVSPSTTALEYAGAVENIFRTHDVPEDSARAPELLEAFLGNNDQDALKKLKVYGDAHDAMVRDLLLISVPPSLAAQHLELIQSLDTLGRATRAVLRYEEDPLAVLGALSLYEPSSKSMLNSLQGMAQVILATSGEPAAGTPGAIIVSLVRSAQQ